MSDLISSFFSSLLPGTRAPRPAAPTRLTSEARTVGSAAPTPTPTPTPASTPSVATTPAPAPAPTSSSSSSSGPGGDDDDNAQNREEIRNLRTQFLDKKFGAQDARRKKKEKKVNGSSRMTSPSSGSPDSKAL
ncbi:hypothetical protein F4778DRAFT_778461 [Xylariomycetidae sp. FL2044]|nr:hypothetical protein F4778DRAFT_778461 [Xylariomycetidae sp. FL2044]